MKTKITVNGVDHLIHLPRNCTKLHRALKAFAGSLGVDFIRANIFIYDYPERGRSLAKLPGYYSLCAAG